MRLKKNKIQIFLVFFFGLVFMGNCTWAYHRYHSFGRGGYAPFFSFVPFIRTYPVHTTVIERYVPTTTKYYTVYDSKEAYEEPLIINSETTTSPYTVNIPHNGGKGYVPVVLTKTTNGFLGPQGEFYAQFPTVAHLQLMYGNGLIKKEL